MKRLVGAAAIVLALAAAAGGSSGATADVLPIVPGRAIGPVALGMTPTEVAARLGTPTKTQWFDDILRWTYDAPTSNHGYLDVYFAYRSTHLAAVQVLTRTGGRYALWDGSQVGAPFGPFLLMAGEPDQVDRLGMATFRVTYRRLGIGFIMVATPEGAIIVGITVFVPQTTAERRQS